MDEIKPVLKRYKIPLIIFGLLFFTFMFLHWKNAMCIFFDIPLMFGGMYNSTPYNDMNFGYKLFVDDRIRLFTNFTVSIPLNMIYLFVRSNNIMDYLRVYSLSYLIVMFFGLLLNFVIAKRTKRYDIAIVCFSFFCLFHIPNFIWIVKEIHIAILYYFAILQYFLTKEKLKLIDLIPILLIVAYLFESFETTILFGIMLFVFFLFCKGDDENYFYKKIIGFGGLFASLYMLHKLFFVYDNIAGSGFMEWWNLTVQMFQNLFTGNLIITVASLGLFIFACFYKNPFSLKSLPFFIIFSALTSFAVIYKTDGYPNVFYNELSAFTIALVFMFPVFLVLFVLDRKNIKIGENFWGNLLIIGCVCGILQLGWQINSAVKFNDYYSYLKNMLNDKSGKFAVKIPPKDFYSERGLRYHCDDAIILLSIFLSETHKVEKIIIPTNLRYSFYNKYTDTIMINSGLHLKIKTKYYDLTKVKEYCLSLPVYKKKKKKKDN